MAHSAEAGPSTATTEPQWLLSLKADIATRHTAGTLVNIPNPLPVQWKHWETLPRLKRAFLEEGKRPGGALCPLDAEGSPPTVAQLEADPATYFTFALRRLASILDPRVIREAAGRNVTGADIFTNGPVWMTPTNTLSYPCMLINHAAVYKKLRPKRTPLEPRRNPRRAYTRQQARNHHHCFYSNTTAGRRQGRYLQVNLGTGCVESAHAILCALYSQQPRPQDALDAHGKVHNPRTKHQVSHICHNHMCLRPQHMTWAIPVHNARQPQGFGTVAVTQVHHYT